MKPKNASWPQPSATAKCARPRTISRAGRGHGRLERLGEEGLAAPAVELELAEPADQGAEMADQERLPLAGSPQRLHAPRRHDHVGGDRQGGEDHAAGQAPRRQPAGIDQAGDHDRDVDAEMRQRRPWRWRSGRCPRSERPAGPSCRSSRTPAGAAPGCDGPGAGRARRPPLAPA